MKANTTMDVLRQIYLILLITLSNSFTSTAFTTSHSSIAPSFTISKHSSLPSVQHLVPSQWEILEPSTVLSSTSNHLALATIDPATALSQLLSGFVGSPAVLLVPIFVGFSVAAVIAAFIVWYANPTDPDE